ncbi:Hypothetical protein Nlim_1294 [Candidatus Nitrosarchaeum limnium SFB1]|jgi:hypothetical protein|uniref:Uncharacterized protein n=1 Tax=Candidatus Nitrosarchaeum limnium SFB1 TaxID=886738 RepID=F3KLB5_9ARCH|nr:Hypothetical protein Nlim_1294 [Candidatus Nitrosarchaeum limnium SFB1]
MFWDFLVSVGVSFGISLLIPVILFLISKIPTMKIRHLNEDEWRIASYRATILASVISIISLAIVIFMFQMSLIQVQSSIDSTNQLNDLVNVTKKQTDSLETAIEKLSKIIEAKESAQIERSSQNFNPELKFRIYGFYPDIREPHTLRAEVENMHNDHTYLKTKWTVTGEICTDDKKVWGSNFNYSNRTEFDLSKNEEKVIRIQIPDKLFELAKGKSFIMMLEMEMNPFTPSGGPINTIEIPKKTFVQFDYNEERNQNWLPWINPGGDLDCTKEPSIRGDAYLNTTSIYDFNDYKNWEFPEE